MSDQIFAVIPCAGIGQRASVSIPKQYHVVAGRTLLEHVLRGFNKCSKFAQIIVAISPYDQYFDSYRFENLHYVVRRCGGVTRHNTVLNTLFELPRLGARENDWVMVHDAVRPGITEKLIWKLITSVGDDPVGGLLALPMDDTLKRSKESDAIRRILCTEPRDGLWLAQTPQMFRLGMLREALQRALVINKFLTDEASAIEAMGLQPILVHGSLRNFKVTWPDDFALAHDFLR